jgi:hypothetical protein
MHDLLESTNLCLLSLRVQLLSCLFHVAHMVLFKGKKREAVAAVAERLLVLLDLTGARRLLTREPSIASPEEAAEVAGRAE